MQGKTLQLFPSDPNEVQSGTLVKSINPGLPQDTSDALKKAKNGPWQQLIPSWKYPWHNIQDRESRNVTFQEKIYHTDDGGFWRVVDELDQIRLARVFDPWLAVPPPNTSNGLVPDPIELARHKFVGYINIVAEVLKTCSVNTVAHPSIPVYYSAHTAMYDINGKDERYIGIVIMDFCRGKVLSKLPTESRTTQHLFDVLDLVFRLQKFGVQLPQPLPEHFVTNTKRKPLKTLDQVSLDAWLKLGDPGVILKHCDKEFRAQVRSDWSEWTVGWTPNSAVTAHFMRAKGKGHGGLNPGDTIQMDKFEPSKPADSVGLPETVQDAVKSNQKDWRKLMKWEVPWEGQDAGKPITIMLVKLLATREDGALWRVEVEEDKTVKEARIHDPWLYNPIQTDRTVVHPIEKTKRELFQRHEVHTMLERIKEINSKDNLLQSTISSYYGTFGATIGKGDERRRVGIRLIEHVNGPIISNQKHPLERKTSLQLLDILLLVLKLRLLGVEVPGPFPSQFRQDKDGIRTVLTDLRTVKVKRDDDGAPILQGGSDGFGVKDFEAIYNNKNGVHEYFQEQYYTQVQANFSRWPGAGAFETFVRASPLPIPRDYRRKLEMLAAEQLLSMKGRAMRNVKTDYGDFDHFENYYGGL